jgi:DNA repair exonuclease SbcCD nuclease subunit
LSGLVCEPRHTVLIAHGTLRDGDGAAFAGEGEDGAYMPIFAEDLSRRCTYAALGHLHAGASLVRRENERLVAYAGSPVATSRRELGPRCLLVVDFEPGIGVLAHETVALATPYYERTEVTCLPGAEQEAIEQLAQQAAALKAVGVRVLARLSGVSTEPEAALREAAGRALARAWGAPLGTRSPSRPDDDATAPILELTAASHPQLAQIAVVSEFVTRLAASARSADVKDPRTLEAALRLGLGAFVEALP